MNNEILKHYRLSTLRVCWLWRCILSHNLLLELTTRCVVRIYYYSVCKKVSVFQNKVENRCLYYLSQTNWLLTSVVVLWSTAASVSKYHTWVQLLLVHIATHTKTRVKHSTVLFNHSLEFCECECVLSLKWLKCRLQIKSFWYGYHWIITT